MNSSRVGNLSNRNRFALVYAMVAASATAACNTGLDDGGIDLDDSEVVIAAFDATALTWGVWKGDLAGAEVERLDLPTGDPGFPETQWLTPQWSPDGGSMMFNVTSTGTDDRYYVMFDRQGRNRRPVSPVGGFADLAVWSPDGRRVLYQAGTVGELIETHIVNLTTGVDEPVKLVEGVRVGGVAIFFNQAPGGICFGPPDSCGLYDAAFIDDDELLVVGAVGKKWNDPTLTGQDLELFAVNLETGRPTRRVTNNQLDETRFQLSPDASHAIVLVPGNTALTVVVLNLSTGQRTTVADLATGFRSTAMRWTNDSRKIVWVDEDEGVHWFDIRDPQVDHLVAELAGASQADLHFRD